MSGKTGYCKGRAPLQNVYPSFFYLKRHTKQKCDYLTPKFLTDSITELGLESKFYDRKDQYCCLRSKLTLF